MFVIVPVHLPSAFLSLSHPRVCLSVCPCSTHTWGKLWPFIKRVLNWTHFCYANLVQGVRLTWKSISKCSWFLIGQVLICEPALGSLKNWWSYVQGPKCFAQHALGTVHQIQQTLPLIGWEQIALLWMRKKGQKEKWMTVLIFHSLWRELTYLLTCGRCSLVSGT